METRKIISFVLSRETAEGGFSFAQTTPRTLDDTYYALKTFEALGYDYQSCKTRKYVRGVQVDKFTLSKTLYRLAYLSCRLHLHAHEHLTDLIVLRLSTADYSFDDLYFLVSSLAYVRPVPPISHAPGSRIFCLSVQDLRTVRHVLRQLFLMGRMDIPFGRARYVEWIRNTQNGDGGFGFYPGTTSFLENTYYALRALELLESEPADLEGCRRFVQGCQASNGGFGRQSISVPRLDSTYHAVSSLDRLDKMRS